MRRTRIAPRYCFYSEWELLMAGCRRPVKEAARQGNLVVIRRRRAGYAQWFKRRTLAGARSRWSIGAAS